MKKTLFLIFVSFSINSCASENQLPNFRFSNFENTNVWELAKAINDDNAEKTKELATINKSNIDFKDSKYQQTLLTLSIVNNKRNAFLELLKAGANPNKLTGKFEDSTPFISSIIYQENCDQFFIENLLKFKANVNQQIITDDFFTQTNSFPLLAAIGNSSDNGEECLQTIELLVNNGANINCCVYDPNSKLCDGVVSKCLTLTCLKTLRYFVVEKSISLPKKVFATGQIDPETMELYSLSEALNSEDFKYEDFTDETLGFIDKSELRKLKAEILDYLKKAGKE